MKDTVKKMFRRCLLHIVHCTLFIVLCTLFASLSCRRYNTQQIPQDTSEIERKRQEILMRVNQEMVEEDSEKIATFAEEKGWQMKKTESGLWYMIYENGKGKKAETRTVAVLEYALSLLNGTICYSSEQFGQKEFLIGHSDIEKGLEEGVLLMREGDKARFLMPPHLAHGLIGDGVCIPRRAIILYDVELVRIID